MNRNKYILLLLPLWFALYFFLEDGVNFLFFDILKLNNNDSLIEAIRFFVFEVPKVLLLLVLIIFVVGIIRTWFQPERTRKLLEGKQLVTGNIMAALLGIVTPFCTCSAIPLFIGFIEAGVPLGVTFSFLISAPMINEVAVILLLGLFGWKVTLIYVLTGLSIAIISGFIIGKLKMEKYVQDWVYAVKMQNQQSEMTKLAFNDRIDYGITAVKDIVKKVWIYIIIGIGIGAAVHGYVPQETMTKIMSGSEVYSIPLSVLIGVPLYSNAAGIIPIVSVLIEKGVPLGTALAFMMSVIGLSLPEIIILKKVLKWQLIAAFVGIVTTGILIVGYLFNYIL